MSEAEDCLALHLRANGIEYVREYRFAAEHVGTQPGVRKRLKESGLQDWRADFALLEHRMLIECEGGGWTGGRHVRGKGFQNDMEKYDSAQRLGYTVYRCSPAMIKTGRAIETIILLVALAQGRSGCYV